MKAVEIQITTPAGDLVRVGLTPELADVFNDVVIICPGENQRAIEWLDEQGAAVDIGLLGAIVVNPGDAMIVRFRSIEFPDDEDLDDEGAS